MEPDNIEKNININKESRNSPDDKMTLSYQSSNESGYQTQNSNFSESLSEQLSESFISNDSKRKYDLINKTPSKYENNDFALNGKSPMKSGGKNAMHYLLASFSRMSPRSSPAQKKANLGSHLNLVSSSNTSPEALKQSTPLETQKAKRVLFLQPTDQSVETQLPSCEGFTKPTTFNRLLGKTNTLFRLPLACSPQKKGQQALINNILEENLNADGKLKALKCSRVGMSHIDFVHEFSLRGGLENIVLQYLSNEDLFNCALVNAKWYNAVITEVLGRKVIFEREIISEKMKMSAYHEDIENTSPFPMSRKMKMKLNLNQSSSSLRSFSETNEADRSGRLSDSFLKPSSLSNTNLNECSTSSEKEGKNSNRSLNQSSSSTSSVSTWAVFARDSRASREDKVVKCPSCCGRAIVLAIKDEGKCEGEMCGYHFCNKCDSPYHGADSCRQVVSSAHSTRSVFIFSSIY